MKTYRHRVVGLYASLADAQEARDFIVAGGIPPEHVRVLTANSNRIGADTQADSDDVLKDVLRDGAIGTAVGTAAGVGVSMALAAAELTLFIANPVLGALYLVGWGASLGGFIGAVLGSEHSRGNVSTLIKDALALGQVVLIVQAHTEAETALAQELVHQHINAGPSPMSSASQPEPPMGL